MKKKHWQVSVFDKTSETIRDDTLYTTDTEVYLVFELIDEDFTPDSATVTLYNIYGTATINESVNIVNGIVNYEMPVDAIGHSGGWRTQVVFNKDNEDYTTTVIDFDVDGHLLDNNKPTIVYIENWNSFIKHGERLVDDWEQLEKIRQANERKRELAESARQNEFEVNETNRQTNELTRESAESVRVSNEEERELNEVERISKDSERDSKIETVIDDVNSKIVSKADVSDLELYAKKEQEDWQSLTIVGGGEGWVKFRVNDFGVVEVIGELVGGAFFMPSKFKPLTNAVRLLPRGDGWNARYLVHAQIRADTGGYQKWHSEGQLVYIHFEYPIGEGWD